MTEPPRYSHPPENGQEGVLLEDHLADLADRVSHVYDESAAFPCGTEVGEVLRRLAWTHDAGKATSWFQHHIGQGGRNPPAAYYTHHSLFGAFLSAYVLENCGYEDELILAGTLAVLRHHGTLGDGPKDLFKRAEPDEGGQKQRLEAVEEQANDINAEVPSLAAKIVDKATDGRATWDEFVGEIRHGSAYERVRDLVSAKGFVPTFSRDRISPRFYETSLELWSGLVLCDKTSAAGTPNSASTYSGSPVSGETLENYIDQLQRSADNEGKSGEINDLRSQARSQVLTAIQNEAPEVATITLPTGLGKTLTGLSAAFEICDVTERGRIVYALPFTSIIDQVGDELQEVFNSDGTDGRVLLHHHLSEATVGVDDSLEDTDAAGAIEAMLGESWRASIVLTTFVQLFESLAGPKNTQSMKLPALHDSVVILDEPQSLPHEWWPLVNRLIDILTDQYGAAVLAMTATQPSLFEDTPPELVDTREAFYKKMERVVFQFDPSIRSFSDVGAAISTSDAAQRILSEEDDSVLTVCNTIDSAESVFNGLQSSEIVTAGSVLNQMNGAGDDVDVQELLGRLLEEGGRPVVFLSTRVRPRDRLILIDLLKRLTRQGIPVICVSTQLIEAGVDISFDRVYRDFAPLDSIVQAGGRCNRSYEGGEGRVIVWWLRGDPDSTYTPAQAVYDLWGESLLSLTKQSLDSVCGDSSVVSEATVTWNGVREYYERVSSNNPGNRELVKHLESGRADKLEQVSLIRDRMAVDVVVCRDSDDENLIREIKEAWSERQFESLRELIRETRPIQVSIPIYDPGSEEAQALGELEPLHDETDIRILRTSNTRFGQYFDVNTGLTVPDSTVEARFL